MHRKWISNVGGPVLNRALAGDGNRHIVAELGEHCETAAPDLLHLQLGSHIRVVGQTQRVKSLATRVHQIEVMSTEWTTVHTVSLDGTHQDNLAGQHGKDGLGAHQHGGTHVVQGKKLEDHVVMKWPEVLHGRWAMLGTHWCKTSELLQQCSAIGNGASKGVWFKAGASNPDFLSGEYPGDFGWEAAELAADPTTFAAYRAAE